MTIPDFSALDNRQAQCLVAMGIVAFAYCLLAIAFVSQKFVRWIRGCPHVWHEESCPAWAWCMHSDVNGASIVSKKTCNVCKRIEASIVGTGSRWPLDAEFVEAFFKGLVDDSKLMRMSTKLQIDKQERVAALEKNEAEKRRAADAKHEKDFVDQTKKQCACQFEQKLKDGIDGVFARINQDYHLLESRIAQIEVGRVTQADRLDIQGRRLRTVEQQLGIVFQ